jgi:hypothetical protein
MQGFLDESLMKGADSETPARQDLLHACLSTPRGVTYEPATLRAEPKGVDP